MRDLCLCIWRRKWRDAAGEDLSGGHGVRHRRIQTDQRFVWASGRDKLLREFTTRLKDVCRGYDYVARMGGDEFVITAPGLTAEAAREKAELLNQAAIEAGRHVAGGI